MEGMDKEKNPPQIPPTYEDAIKVESGAIVDDSADATCHERRRKHRILALVVLFGLIIYYFTLFGTVRHHLRATRSSTNSIRNYWGPRQRRIEINGRKSLWEHIDLEDLIDIRSESASLRAVVHPKPANVLDPVPAELVINTQSGSISTSFVGSYEAVNIPEREYHTTIKTESGRITAILLHGRRTTMESSTSLPMFAEVTLYRVGNYSSTLTTTTVTGDQELTVRCPKATEDQAVSAMTSFHRSKSGHLELIYPTGWEGTIEGRTQSGDLRLVGIGIEIIRQSSYGPSGQYVLAKKGNGNSTLNIETASGDATIWFKTPY